jgi:hypothetical protein
MKITLDNYESWLLDYMEEKLSSVEHEGVRLFLTQHPDLAEELADFLPALKADKLLSFPGKERLKRTVFDDPAHFETTAIAALEGDLGQEEQIEFKKWLDKNPAQKTFMQELESCRLQANLEISFPAKSRLKKKTITVPLWIKVVSAAAVLLIALLTFYPEDQLSNTVSSLTNNPSLSGKQNNPAKIKNIQKNITLSASANASDLNARMKRASLSPKKLNKAPKIMVAEARQKIVIQSLESKCTLVQSFNPDFSDLMPVKVLSPVYAASNEISLSDYLKSKMKELRAEGPNEYYTREEVTLAGLHLFSKVPGNHLTGKKGSDGRLTSISFNTHLLAFSIPVNR